jgi:formylglycine-generating enzyme required for sulfatase activity
MPLPPEGEHADPTQGGTLTSILKPRVTALTDDDMAAVVRVSPLNEAQIRQVVASIESLPRLSVITDAATTDDRLGFQPLVRTLANIVLSSSTETPLAIAMDGKWGSGKTSILKMVESQARLVGFNSIWLNAWALERAEHLIAELTAGIQDELARSGRTPGGTFSDKLGVFLGRAFASLVPERLGGQVVRGLVQANVKTAETQADTAEIASIVRTQRAFQDLVNILLERGSASQGQHRLLVLIDDLDRALPDQVTSMLKNLKQLVEMEGCVFLLAMDVDLVAKGIEDFYRARYTAGSNISLRSTDGSTRLDVTPEHGSITPGFGRNYLEKLVQIILPVPQLSRAVVMDCVRSFGFAEEVVEMVAWAPDAEILNPRRLKRYLNTLSVTLQLVTASSLPGEFDNAYALRALALRRDWRRIYDHLLTLLPSGISAQEWPEARTNDNDIQERFRSYLSKLSPETGALGRFESFVSGSNLFPTGDVAFGASPKQPAKVKADDEVAPAGPTEDKVSRSEADGRIHASVEQHIVTATPPTRVLYNDGDETYGEWVKTRGIHALHLPRVIRIARYLVTNAFYLQFVLAGGYEKDEYWHLGASERRSFVTADQKSPGPGSWLNSGTIPQGKEDHPVSSISYVEALAFVDWCNAGGAGDPGTVWSLPPEDQWEFAARSEQGFHYPWGDAFDGSRCNSVESGIGGTASVRQFENGASAAGCCDMAGNVWEFVVADDIGDSWCVLRGGSFLNNRFEVRSCLRLFGVPWAHRAPDFGFRLAQLEAGPVRP